MKLLGIISVGFGITDQLLIRYFAFIRYWKKYESTMRQCISYSYTSRKPMIWLGEKYEYCTVFLFLRAAYVNTVWGTHEATQAD
jgi:hypothetical protein